jgi:hypothetical protein
MSRAESWIGVTGKTEVRLAGDKPARFSSSVVTQTNRAASTLIFATGFSPSQARADQGGSEIQRVESIRPAYREVSGLNANELDQLLGDDFDTLSHTSSLQAAAKSRFSPGFEKPPATAPEGSGATGGAPRSDGEGQLPPAPG